MLAISGTIDRYRWFRGRRAPRHDRVVAVGDAWACTNPSLVLRSGCSTPHVLPDVVRSELGSPGRLAEVLDAVTEAELTPWYQAR